MQVWTNGDEMSNVVEISKFLNGRVASSKTEFRAFIINLTKAEADVEWTKKLAAESAADKIGTTHLSTTDPGVKNYKVSTDPEVKNTVFVYARRKVAAKFVNFKADKESLAKLGEAITAAGG